MPSPAVRRDPRNPTAPTSLKLPAGLKREIDALAGERGISPHAFMVQALTEATERARLLDKFQADSIDALDEMRKTGKGYELGAVREYFGKLAAHRKGEGPKPRRPSLAKVT